MTSTQPADHVANEPESALPFLPNRIELRALVEEQTAIYAEQVQQLRQRVAELESALATATTRLDAQETGAAKPVAAEAVGTENAAAGADQAFAEAWSEDEESSFEEKIAQKAFFRVGSIDEASRNWLLTR